MKRGTTLPGNIPPQPALPPAKGPATPSQQLTADQPQTPMYRHNVKKPLTEVRPTGQAMTTTTQPYQTAILHPKEVSPTQDYWIKEGPYWKRVHVQPRRDMYIPQQTDNGPDVTRLTTWRQTMVKPTSGNRGYRIDDDWTTKRKATLNIEWTGSTYVEENAAYKDEFITDEPEEQQEAKGAKGVPTPQQPTEQERREHELTHLPYRSWCPTCVQSKGRQDNHPKQTSKTPGIQVDLMYYEALGEKQTTSVLTAVDVETSICMAVQLEDKAQHVQYLSVCLQQFLMECGRTHAILNNTVLQSDQEDFIISLLKMVATAMGSNIAVRQAPAYTSQAQGSAERFHRTLMGQFYSNHLGLPHWASHYPCWECAGENFADCDPSLSVKELDLEKASFETWTHQEHLEDPWSDYPIFSLPHVSAKNVRGDPVHILFCKGLYSHLLGGILHYACWWEGPGKVCQEKPWKRLGFIFDAIKEEYRSQNLSNRLTNLRLAMFTDAGKPWASKASLDIKAGEAKHLLPAIVPVLEKLLGPTMHVREEERKMISAATSLEKLVALWDEAGTFLSPSQFAKCLALGKEFLLAYNG